MASRGEHKQEARAIRPNSCDAAALPEPVDVGCIVAGVGRIDLPRWVWRSSVPHVDIHGPLHYLGVMDLLCGATGPL